MVSLKKCVVRKLRMISGKSYLPRKGMPMFLINRTFILTLMIIINITTSIVHPMLKNLARLGTTARPIAYRSLASVPKMTRVRPYEQDLVNNFDRLLLSKTPINVPKRVIEHKIPKRIGQKTQDQKLFHESWSGKDYNQNSEPQLDMGLE